jgi:putative alpha-1,2-mannosidase
MFTRFTNCLRPRGLDGDLRDEVEFHIEMRTKEHLRAGMTEGEAAKQAHHRFGDVESVIEKMREARLSSVTMLLAMTTLLATTRE